MTHWNACRVVRPMGALATLAVAALVCAGPVRAADPTTAAAAAPQDPAARALLLNMANFIAQAPGLRVTMRSGYDAIQADGQRIEFGERRQILMQRPDKLRVETERSDGERGGVVFDGRWITAFNASENVYARVEKAGNLDQALVYMVRDLRRHCPWRACSPRAFHSTWTSAPHPSCWSRSAPCSMSRPITSPSGPATWTCNCGSRRGPSRCRDA